MSRGRATETPAALLIYPGDYLGDDELSAENLEAIGALFLLLLREWKQEGLPTDHTKLARWLRLTPRRFARIWAAIHHHFEERDGRYYFPRNDLERERQARVRQQASDAGKASARVRAQRGFNGGSTDVAGSVEVPYQRNVNHPSPSPSPSSSTTTGEPDTGEPDTEPADPITGFIHDRYPWVIAWLAEKQSRRDLLDDCLRRVAYERQPVQSYVARLEQVGTDGWVHEGRRVCPTGEQIEAGMFEWWTDTSGKAIKLITWTRYLVLPAIRDAERPSVPATGANGAGATDAKALARGQSQAILTRISALAASAGASRFIPAADVRAMGEDIWRAYQAIGGAARILDASPRDLPFIQHDFHAALLAARSTTPTTTPTD